MLQIWRNAWWWIRELCSYPTALGWVVHIVLCAMLIWVATQAWGQQVDVHSRELAVAQERQSGEYRVYCVSEEIFIQSLQTDFQGDFEADFTASTRWTLESEGLSLEEYRPIGAVMTNMIPQILHALGYEHPQEYW